MTLTPDALDLVLLSLTTEQRLDYLTDRDFEQLRQARGLANGHATAVAAQDTPQPLAAHPENRSDVLDVAPTKNVVSGGTAEVPQSATRGGLAQGVRRPAGDDRGEPRLTQSGLPYLDARAGLGPRHSQNLASRFAFGLARLDLCDDCGRRRLNLFLGLLGPETRTGTSGGADVPVKAGGGR